MNTQPAAFVAREPATAMPAADRRLRIDPAACLSRRFSDSACALCVEACPVAALGSDGHVPIELDACIGCGQCAAVCPTGALSVPGFAPAEEIDPGQALCIDCWRVPAEASPRGALRVPCLGGIGLGWLLALCERTHERPIQLLDRGQCETCPAGSGRFQLRARLAEARALLAECGVAAEALPSIIVLPSSAPLAATIPPAEAEIRIGRRMFFRGLMSGALRGAEQVTAANSANQAGAIVLRQIAQPVDRLRAITALTAIAQRHGRSLPGRLLPQLSLGACSGHAVCTRVCPTAALVRQENDGFAVLEYYAARCIACGQCAQRCPEQAIRIQAEGGTRPYEVLMRWQGQRCPQCGQTHYGSGTKTCQACQKNQLLLQGIAALLRPRLDE